MVNILANQLSYHFVTTAAPQAPDRPSGIGAEGATERAQSTERALDNAFDLRVVTAYVQH